MSGFWLVLWISSLAVAIWSGWGYEEIRVPRWIAGGAAALLGPWSGAHMYDDIWTNHASKPAALIALVGLTVFGATIAAYWLRQLDDVTPTIIGGIGAFLTAGWATDVAVSGLSRTLGIGIGSIVLLLVLGGLVVVLKAMES